MSGCLLFAIGDLGSSGAYHREQFVRKPVGMKYTPVQNLVGNFILYPFPNADVRREHLFRIIQLPKRVYL